MPLDPINLHDSCAKFAPCRQPLKCPKYCEKRRRSGAHGGVVGQAADGGSGDGHEEDAGDEGDLPGRDVGDVSKDDGAHGAHHKSNGEDSPVGEGLEHWKQSMEVKHVRNRIDATPTWGARD